VCACVWFGAAAHISASLAATSTTAEGGAFSAAASVVAVEDIVWCACARAVRAVMECNDKGGVTQP
jgi:hypothetical protein